MKLALYSDQIPPLTDAMDAQVMSLLPPSPRIGYLPSSPDRDRAWFRQVEAYYGRYGAALAFFGVEDDFDSARLPDLFESDAIHLTGGNTFQFAYWLRQRGLFDPLREFAERGGMLIGVSAGAILMTPDISTSSLCGDQPYPGLASMSGLRLVDFHVVPHVGEDLDALKGYSAHVSGTVLGIPDGAGVLVTDHQLTWFCDVRSAQGGVLAG